MRKVFNKTVIKTDKKPPQKRPISKIRIAQSSNLLNRFTRISLRWKKNQ